MQKAIIAVAAFMIAFANADMAYAGVWEQSGETWRYRYENGTYARNGWEWIDGNYDTIAERYYFDSEGILLQDQVISDGSRVNADGAWVNANKIIQHKEIKDIDYNHVSPTETFLNVIRHYPITCRSEGGYGSMGTDGETHFFISNLEDAAKAGEFYTLQPREKLYAGIYYTPNYVEQFSAGDKIKIYDSLFYSYNTEYTVKSILKEGDGFKVFNVLEPTVSFSEEAGFTEQEVYFAFQKIEDGRYVLAILEENQSFSPEDWLENYNGYDSYSTDNDRRHYHQKLVYSGPLFFSKKAIAKGYRYPSGDWVVPISEVINSESLRYNGWAAVKYNEDGYITEIYEHNAA